MATDVLGKYEYKEEFLMASLAFWVIGSFAAGFRSDKTLGKSLVSSLRKAGTTLFGIWILLLILGWFDWLGPVWGGKVNYMLGLSLILFAVSFTVRAMTIKNTNWRIRSTFYSLGFLIVLSWILMRIFDLFSEYQDATILSGIAALAIGYIIGASKKNYDYDLFDEKIEDISKAMDEVKEPPSASEEVRVLDKEFVYGSTHKIIINKGAAYVEMRRGKENCGNVFFGEGSYNIESDFVDEKGHFMGICHANLKDCDNIELEHRAASDDDLENLGLERDDIKELSNIFVQGGEGSYQRLEDLKIKIKEGGKKTEINLPFIKILEGKEGDYVKVGPFEVADVKGKGSSIKIGDRTFVDKKNDTVEHSLEYEDNFRILTTEGSIFIGMSNDNALIESRDLFYQKGENAESISKGDISFKSTADGQRLSSKDLELTIGSECNLISKANGVEIKVRDAHVTLKIGGERKEFEDKELAEMVSELMRTAAPHVVKDTFEGSTVLLNELIMQVTNELKQ